MWAERGPFNTTEQSLFYINALRMKNGCRFHILQFLMVLTSRDKVFGFKREMHFWKTLCYKKENLKCFHCCWSSSEEDTSKSSLIRNHLGKLRNTLNLFSFPQNKFINEQVLFSWIIWLQETDLEKKKKKLQSNTFKMSFTDLPRKVLDFCEEKNILLFIGNNEHYAAVSTSHTFKQSFIYSVNI